ncbi:alpha/beta hydrolase [Psychroserpens luteolus]|uniref:alpha/beta hydrolase n=1 Tax=Psychroserpens luteolus TaxID=2855840 RepID=UPI001E4CF1E4|nr:alpha/beta hydrolase-fold protein [Psychroserpens luteolus]MCD2260823.1 alpha/beta hydrolase [Psychroserpens luteolus]
MTLKTLIALIISTIACQIHAQTPISETSKAVLSIGEKVILDSKILNENRTLNIYLPHSYVQDSLKTYPVIYLLDGSIDEDFLHISGLVQFGSFSWIKMLPESIVVGISNVDRKRDFTYPTSNKKDKADFPTTGKSEAFINFLGTELQPYIDQNYRTNTTKTIIGQSLGGLLATEILFKKPDLFDNYIIVSPSLWWDDNSLLKSKPKAYTTKKSIYVGVGKEGPIMEKAATDLFKTLKSNKKENTQVYFGFFEDLDHGDTLHLAVYDAFELLFKTKK